MGTAGASGKRQPEYSMKMHFLLARIRGAIP
jgi:hypothetical protein